MLRGILPSTWMPILPLSNSDDDMEVNYEQLDPATAPIAEVIEAWAGISGRMEDEQGLVSWSIAEICVESPLELDVHVQADGSVVLGSTPPTTSVETSFSPLLNQLKVTLSSENDLG